MRKTFFHKFADGMYFRVNGYGMAFQRDMPRLFSERNGFRRVFRVGRWSLEFLTPNN